MITKNIIKLFLFLSLLGCHTKAIDSRKPSSESTKKVDLFRELCLNFTFILDENTKVKRPSAVTREFESIDPEKVPPKLACHFNNIRIMEAMQLFHNKELRSICRFPLIANREGFEEHLSMDSIVQSEYWTHAVGALTIFCTGGAP